MYMYCKFYDHISSSHQNLMDVRLLKGKNPPPYRMMYCIRMFDMWSDVKSKQPDPIP